MIRDVVPGQEGGVQVCRIHIHVVSLSMFQVGIKIDEVVMNRLV